jgi:protein-L-isoaspartate(D-aspartate) O-methyltransferase
MTAIAGVPHSPLTAAFASTPRERYLGLGPWKVYHGNGYTQTPTADPTLLYQDIVVALAEEQGINNGQPSLHTRCLAALDVREGRNRHAYRGWRRLLHGDLGNVEFCLR